MFGNKHFQKLFAQELLQDKKLIVEVKKDEKYGLIDEEKEIEIVPCVYDYIGDFQEGFAKVEKDGKRGYINKTGKEYFDKDAKKVDEIYKILNELKELENMEKKAQKLNKKKEKMARKLDEERE